MEDKENNNELEAPLIKKDKIPETHKLSENDYNLIIQRERGLNGFGKPPVCLKENFLLSVYLGVIGLGGPMAHVGMIKKICVEERKYLNDSEFSQLFAICNIIPGPTSSQLFTGICAINTNSVFGGIINFFGFSFPGFIIMTMFALSSNLFKEESTNISNNTSSIYLGIRQGAISLILQAGISLGKKQTNLKPKYILMLMTSTILYFIFQQYFTMIILMISFGLLNLLIKYYQNKNVEANIISAQEVNHRYEVDVTDIHHIHNLNKIKYTGLFSLITFACLYLVLLLIRKLFPDNLNAILAESFYRMGFLIFGGGHVVIPMILTEFTTLNLVNNEQVMMAFSFVSLIPGPMFNISAFIGTQINGILGGIISALSIFTPGILLVFTVLPFINKIKTNITLHNALKGVSVAAIGFIFTSAIILWEETCLRRSVIIGTLNILLCYMLLEYKKINILFVLLFAALFSLGSNYMIY